MMQHLFYVWARLAKTVKEKTTSRVIIVNVDEFEMKRVLYTNKTEMKKLLTEKQFEELYQALDRFAG